MIGLQLGRRLLPPRSREARRQVGSLPRLQRNATTTQTCKICAGPAAAFDIVDFNKVCDHDCYVFGLAGIPVTYYRCSACSFIFTTFFDAWSAADFSRYIYNDDYTLVDPEYSGVRGERTAAEIGPLLRGCETARILDYGSGSGSFAAAMNARGFAHVASYDPFSAPARPAGKFDIITCFETLEHTLAPLTALADILEFLDADGALIIGQTLQPADIGKLRGNWWYIAPRNGHVSVFAESTFVRIADRLGLKLYFGSGTYGFSRPTASAELQTALRRLGRAEVELSAPEEDDERWNDLELNDFTRFRWTRSARLSWPPRPFAAGASRIRIPLLMDVAPGFAKDCRVFVGNDAVPTEVTANGIIARLDLSASAVAGVRLVTPEPQTRPARDGALDHRRRGLAIPVAVDIGGVVIPRNWPAGAEAVRHFVTRLESGFFSRYLAATSGPDGAFATLGGKVLVIGEAGAGWVLDFGCRDDRAPSAPIVPHAISVGLDDGAALPFADCSIDLIFSNHLLEHAGDYIAAIRDWHRVIKTAGFIVCVVPHQFLYEKRRTLPSRWNGDHKRFYTPASLLAEFEAALAPNTYRVRHLIDNDRGYTYDIGPDRHCGGSSEIELVIEKVEKPDWEFDP